MMTAREICSEVYGLSGFGIPSAFFDGGDPDDRLIFYLLRRAARDIAKYRWQQLVKTGRITVVVGTFQYNMPSDFREMIPNTMKTVGDIRDIDFPSNFEAWAQLDSEVGATGIQHRFRFQQNQLIFSDEGDSPENAGEQLFTIRFDYLSDFPVQTSEGVRVNTFSADGDVWLLDEDLIIKGLKAKWSLEKGLDTLQADLADYAQYLNELKGTQAGSQRISMTRYNPYSPQAPYTNTWKS